MAKPRISLLADHVSDKETFDELLRLGQEFRVQQPPAGTTEMISQIAKMVAAYEAISAVDFGNRTITKEAQIKALAGMVHIKRRFADQDWESLSRNRLLYGLTPFAPDAE